VAARGVEQGEADRHHVLDILAAGAGVALELVQRFEQRRDSPRAVVVV